LKYRQREILFREAVIGFFCGPDKPKPEDEYCAICRQAGRATDCKTCTKTFKVIKPEGNE
jgi:hypothetical protein